MTLPQAELGAAWRAARSVPTAGFLDAARCSIPSDAVLAAQRAHHRLEREIGGYEAQAAAESVLTGLRAGLAELLDASADDVGLVQNGTTAEQAVLFGLRLPAGTRVVVTAGDYGSNRLFVQDLAARRGWSLHEVPHRPAGVVDLDALAGELRGGVGLVLLSHVASQRGTVQPAAAVAGMCTAAGALFVLDVAQSLGHVDCTGIGADAYVGTSRKWLAGPRGVGFAVVPSAADQRLDAPHTLDSAASPMARSGRRYESSEADIGSRVGLAAAVAEVHAAGMTRVVSRLASLGSYARGVLDGPGGWRVVEGGDGAAMTTLRPPPGQDPQPAVTRVAAAAATAGLRIGVVPAGRSADHHAAVVRVSPPLGAETDDLDRLAELLARG